MSRRLAGVILLVAAALALGFVLGWTEHRSSQSRLEQARSFCSHEGYTSTGKGTGYDGWSNSRAACIAWWITR